jgi:hypothetical protein
MVLDLPALRIEDQGVVDIRLCEQNPESGKRRIFILNGGVIHDFHQITGFPSFFLREAV